MSNVIFNKLCRNCLTTDGISSIYLLDYDIQDKEKYSEFEFSKFVYDLLKEYDKKCEFCGSSSFDVTKIKIDDYNLYDFDRLVNDCKKNNGELFLWNLRKTSEGISIKVSGKNKHDYLFLRECFLKLYDLINSLSNSDLIKFHFGDTHITFSGKLSMDVNSGESTFNPRIEKFYSAGLSRQEILSCINEQLKSFKMYDLIRDY